MNSRFYMFAESQLKEVKYHIKKVDHDRYFLMMAKDSYLNIHRILLNLEEEINYFRLESSEFVYFNYLHKK